MTMWLFIKLAQSTIRYTGSYRHRLCLCISTYS